MQIDWDRDNAHKVAFCTRAKELQKDQDERNDSQTEVHNTTHIPITLNILH